MEDLKTCTSQATFKESASEKVGSEKDQHLVIQEPMTSLTGVVCFTVVLLSLSTFPRINLL